ncbi:hypothetical protein OROGR_002821 [Orobanche gracilis]
MNSTQYRRRIVPALGSDNGDTADKQEQLFLSSAICNGEDLGPFVRKACWN